MAVRRALLTATVCSARRCGVVTCADGFDGDWAA
jgi:hypothetical protein